MSIQVALGILGFLGIIVSVVLVFIINQFKNIVIELKATISDLRIYIQQQNDIIHKLLDKKQLKDTCNIYHAGHEKQHESENKIIENKITDMKEDINGIGQKLVNNLRNI